MITAILVLLVLALIYFYFTSTLTHLYHTARMAGRMILVVTAILLILGLLGYSVIKFGTVF